MENEVSDSQLKERKRLSIFISYGHTDSDKVKPIVAALEEKGYQLWIDEEKICPGEIWRRDIIKGITDCDVFIAFLSKYSMRDPGVCRDEVQISVGIKGGNIKTVLLEPQDEVRPPATIAHTQWLDLSTWSGSEEKLPQILEDICKMVELRENYILEDEIDLLRKLMNPVDCEARKKELCKRQMFGRKWLYDALKKWDEQNKSNIFWLSGGAGFGKSMFAVNLCFAMADKVVAAHFVEWNNPDKHDAATILKSLAFQLARRYPDYRKFIMALPVQKKTELFARKCEPDKLCDELFCEQAGLCIDGGHETAWVLIDALDEATKNGKNPVAAMIAQYRDRFPSWLKFIITSRDDAAVRTALGSLDPDIYDLDEKISQFQKQDMMEFLRAALAECRFNDSVYELLIEKSEGMFLYLRYASEEILTRKLSVNAVRDLPKGITGIYDKYFERHFGRPEDYAFYDEKIRPVLEVYSAAYEALTLDLFAAVAGTDVRSIRNAVARLGTLKVDRIERKNKKEKESFQLCHKSVWDWLTSLPAGEGSYRVEKAGGAEILTGFCLKKIKEYDMEQLVKNDIYEYPLRHVIRHLAEQQKEDEIWELLGGTDPRLPKLQKDYFGSFAASVDSLKTAILFYMDLYRSGRSGKVLSRLCRLMVTLASLQAEQQKELKNVFARGNSLEQTLDYMDSIQDVKIYYIIGCYLLTKVEENHWDMDQLISAIEKRCSGNIESIDSDDIGFLAKGIFPKVIRNMNEKQVIRLLRLFSHHYDAKSIMDGLKDQMNLPQAARVYWYFDKLDDAECGSLGDCSKPEEEQERIQAIENADDRCEELLKLAVNFYIHDDLSEAEKWLEKAVSLLKEVNSTWRLKEAAELYWNMGKSEEAGKLLLEHRDIYGNIYGSERDFINALCQYGLPEKAYGFFESCILPDAKEASEFLKKSISPVFFLMSLAENGKGETILALSEFVDRLGYSDTVSLLKTLIQTRQEKAAAELLDAFCDRKGNEDCFFKHPELLPLMRKLKDSGFWAERIPEEKDLEEFHRAVLDEFKDLFEFKDFQSKKFSPAFQLELIREAWQLFSSDMANPELSTEDKESLVNEMNGLLAFNSSGLKKDLAPDVCRFLDKVKEFSEDYILFAEKEDFFIDFRYEPIEERIENWITGLDTLLSDSLEKEKISEFVKWFNRKTVEAMEDGHYVTASAVKALLQYYFMNRMWPEKDALLEKVTIAEKLDYVLSSFASILGTWRSCSEKNNVPLPLIPECFADAIDSVFRSCDQRRVRLGNNEEGFTSFLKNLEPYRAQNIVDRICTSVWRFLDPIFNRSKKNDMDEVFLIISSGVWSISDEQFSRWFKKLQTASADEDCVGVNWEKCLTFLIDYRTKRTHLEENWHRDILADLPKIKDLGDRKKVLMELFAATVRKGTPAQQQEILARMDNTVLIGNSYKLRDLDLEKLYGALTGGNISDAAIRTVMKDMNWKNLGFDKMCLIAPHMLDEKEYVEHWFPALFRKLQEKKDLASMETISRECPELGLPVLPSDRPENTVSSPAFTLDMIAGMVPTASAASPLAAQIMELRKQLAEENITPKGYKLGMEKLLASLPEEKKQQIAALEQALNDELITEKGFANKLSGILG